MINYVVWSCFCKEWVLRLCVYNDNKFNVIFGHQLQFVMGTCCLHKPLLQNKNNLFHTKWCLEFRVGAVKGSLRTGTMATLFAFSWTDLALFLWWPLGNGDSGHSKHSAAGHGWGALRTGTKAPSCLLPFHHCQDHYVIIALFSVGMCSEWLVSINSVARVSAQVLQYVSHGGVAHSDIGLNRWMDCKCLIHWREYHISHLSIIIPQTPLKNALLSNMELDKVFFFCFLSTDLMFI